MQPLIVAFDMVSAAAFAVALIYALRLPLSPGRALDRGTKLAMVLMMFLYVFVGASNILERAGVTTALDLYEDFFEVLFVPLIAYAAISSSAAARLRRELQVQKELRLERDFSTSVMDATPAGIVFVDAAGIFMFANERARQLLGESAEDAFTGGPVFIERDGAFPEPRTLAEIAAEGIMTSRRFTVMGIEELRVLALTSAPMAEEGMIVNMLDATARVLSERELEQYRRELEVLVERRTGQLVETNMELEAANTAKKTFLTTMSDELRTPLRTVLASSSELLQESAGEINEEQARRLRAIREAGAELLVLVDDVLDIAMIEAGHVGVELREVDAASLVEAVVQEFAQVAEAAGVEMQLALDDDGPFDVQTDSRKLVQVLQNLIDNAIKFTGQGGVVKVELSSEQDELSIMIRDTGIGVAPYDQGRIFAAFYQASPPGEEKAQGAGLGLAIVWQLCELIGAHVEVQSALGFGSTFTLHVPRRDPALSS